MTSLIGLFVVKSDKSRLSLRIFLSKYKSLSSLSLSLNRSGPVEGSWGSWADWTSCSRVCKGGTETRRRLCDSPAPAHGGADCQGDESEERPCNTHYCVPGKQENIWYLFFYIDDVLYLCNISTSYSLIFLIIVTFFVKPHVESCLTVVYNSRISNNGRRPRQLP